MEGGEQKTSERALHSDFGREIPLSDEAASLPSRRQLKKQKREQQLKLTSFLKEWEPSEDTERSLTSAEFQCWYEKFSNKPISKAAFGGVVTSFYKLNKWSDVRFQFKSLISRCLEVVISNATLLTRIHTTPMEIQEAIFDLIYAKEGLSQARQKTPFLFSSFSLSSPPSPPPNPPASSGQKRKRIPNPSSSLIPGPEETTVLLRSLRHFLDNDNLKQLPILSNDRTKSGPRHVMGQILERLAPMFGSVYHVIHAMRDRPEFLQYLEQFLVESKESFQKKAAMEVLNYKRSVEQHFMENSSLALEGTGISAGAYEKLRKVLTFEDVSTAKSRIQERKSFDRIQVPNYLTELSAIVLPIINTLVLLSSEISWVSIKEKLINQLTNDNLVTEAESLQNLAPSHLKTLYMNQIDPSEIDWEQLPEKPVDSHWKQLLENHPLQPHSLIILPFIYERYYCHFIRHRATILKTKDQTFPALPTADEIKRDIREKSIGQ